MISVPRIDDTQRRARLGTRHALAPAHRVDGVLAAAGSVVCLHATEPASVHLAAFARAEVTHADLERALYADRTLVKQLAMRRTLFAFPRDLLPAAWGSASARVVQQTVQHLGTDLIRSEIVADRGAAQTWVSDAAREVVDHLHSHGPATTTELRGLIPTLDTRVEFAAGTAWSSSQPVAAVVLTAAAAGGEILRGENAAGWRVTRPRWTATRDWLGEVPAHLTPQEGYAALVTAWLARFGPGTEADIVWWLGATKTAVRRALADIEAVEVEVTPSAGASGAAYVLAGDVEPVEQPAPWAALLPALDPTLMGWKDRDFYLGPHRSELFDSNGNGGPTAWWDGRVVGGWCQTPDGEVVVVPLVDLGREAAAALEVEAQRLTAFLAGDVVNTIYQSPLLRRHLSSG